MSHCCQDTKDYAAEVLAELLTLETIQVRFTQCNTVVTIVTQGQFIELGGLQTLCALLRSSRERVVYEVSCALSFIASSHDQHKSKIVDNNGWVYHPNTLLCVITSITGWMICSTPLNMAVQQKWLSYCQGYYWTCACMLTVAL